MLAQSGIDAEERDAADKLQKLIMGELHHRIKNNLATVSAIASQSFRTTTSIEHGQKAMEGRLLALSRAREQTVRGGVMDGQPLPLCSGLGRRQKRPNGAPGPVHVVGRVAQDAICRGGRGIAQGRGISCGGGTEFGRLYPCLFELLRSRGTSCVRIDVGARDCVVRGLLRRGPNRGRVLRSLLTQPEQLCADLTLLGREACRRLRLQLRDLRPDLLELCGRETAKPLVLSPCGVLDLLGLGR